METVATDPVIAAAMLDEWGDKVAATIAASAAAVYATEGALHTVTHGDIVGRGVSEACAIVDFTGRVPIVNGLSLYDAGVAAVLSTGELLAPYTVAKRSGIPVDAVAEAFDRLAAIDVVKRVAGSAYIDAPLLWVVQRHGLDVATGGNRET